MAKGLSFPSLGIIDQAQLIFTDGYTTLGCEYTRRNQSGTSGRKPRGFMYTRFLIHNTHTHTHAQASLQSPLKATSLPNGSRYVSVLPVVPVWLCWRLASLTGVPKVTAWFVLQHKQAWQHQFPWYGGGTAWERLWLCGLHFKLELQRSAQRAGCCEFNVSLSSALFSVGDDCHFIHLAWERDSGAPVTFLVCFADNILRSRVT